MTAPPPSPVTLAPGLLDRTEKIVKLAASLAAISAAIGLPAVYLHYSRLGIPSSYIDYEQILRAGIVPGLLLLFVGAYVLLLIQGYRQRGADLAGLLAPGLIFAPIPLVVLGLLFAGLFAALVFMFWVVLIPIFYLLELGLEGPLQFWGANGMVLVALALSWLNGWRKTRNTQAAEAGSLAGDAPESEAAAETAPPTRAGRRESTGTSDTTILVLFTLGAVAYLLVGLFALDWYLERLGILSGPLAGPGEIVVLASVGGLALGAGLGMIVTWDDMGSQDQTKRLKAILLNISLVVAFFVAGVWWYSSALYPRLPVALGGGSLERVVVWIDPGALPPEFRADAGCSEIEPLLRCARLRLVHHGDKDVILALPDAEAPAGLAVPRDAIKAVTW